MFRLEVDIMTHAGPVPRYYFCWSHTTEFQLFFYDGYIPINWFTDAG